MIVVISGQLLYYFTNVVRLRFLSTYVFFTCVKNLFFMFISSCLNIIQAATLENVLYAFCPAKNTKVFHVDKEDRLI